ncbi:MAG TPA: LytTR family DNA-binding domain-containing protein [Sphingobacterium sp.]|nr:LytTR family DNA-binding domain-containing protein [Sphingobacterium sp.]
MKKQIILIVDNDRLFRTQLIDELKRISYPAVFWEAANGTEGLRSINALQPDIVFLDVELPSLGAFEVLDKMEHSPAIVLMSDSANYAAKAFEYDAVDYLVKPLTHKRLQAALQRAANPTKMLMGLPSAEQTYPKRILVEKGKRLTSIPVSAITHLKADRDYTWIHTLQQESFLSSYGIGEFTEKLDPHQFLRVHRSYIVNIDHIQELYRDINKVFLTLPNRIELSVSRNYMPYIKAYIF